MNNEVPNLSLELLAERIFNIELKLETLWKFTAAVLDKNETELLENQFKSEVDRNQLSTAEVEITSYMNPPLSLVITGGVNA